MDSRLTTMTATITSHRRTNLREVRMILAAAVAISSWYGAGILLRKDILGVLMFIGPGVLFGLGAGWLGHLFGRDRFTWATGLRSAIAGGVLLPPLFGALVAFGGLVDPQLTYMLFVLGAWGALAAGVLLAFVMRLGATSRRFRS